MIGKSTVDEEVLDELEEILDRFRCWSYDHAQNHQADLKAGSRR